MWGLPLALSATDTEPDLEPVADGVNTTEIVQLEPAGRGDKLRQLLPDPAGRVKSAALVPVGLMLLIVRLAVPVFNTVTVFVMLGTLTTWFPNAMLLGVNDMPGAPELMPVPDRDRVAPEFGSVIVPVLLPTAVGVNVTVPEHDADAASVPGVQPFVARA